jgi:hypothetical protein
MNFKVEGTLRRGIGPSQGHNLHKTAQTQNKSRQTCVLRVEFEPTIPVFEQAKTFLAYDRSANDIGF